MIKNGLINALTIDVEDAVNQAMMTFFKTDIAPTYRVFENTSRLLDLFEEYDTKATFFIVGEVAQSYPSLIRRIAEQDHELGIHGYAHIPYYRLSREEVRQEISRSKKLVEDIAGKEVLGHRAPEFSINPESQWIFEILLDEGIQYDSSIIPVKMKRYGWSGFSRDIGWVKLRDGRKIIEAPLTTLKLLGIETPVCGGGYLRAMPLSFTNIAFNTVMKDRPVNVYLHPYEIDPPPFQDFYMEAVSNSSLKHKMRLKSYWFNRRTVIPKLKVLLEKYNFTTLHNVIEGVIN